LEARRCLPFDRQFDSALAGVAVPDAVVEAELHFLFDVSGEVIGRDPRSVDVEGGFATVIVLVDHPQLVRVPGGAILRTDETALAGGHDGLEPSAERKVDQLDVMDGDIGAGVASLDPFGELT